MDAALAAGAIFRRHQSLDGEETFFVDERVGSTLEAKEDVGANATCAWERVGRSAAATQDHAEGKHERHARRHASARR